MIKIENSEVFNFEGAIRGMRNPMNSWDKSDSGVKEIYGIGYEFVIGENDLKLMKSLVKAGSDHRKFLRQIFVSVDITAPLYWWKEFDTYKVGTTANSCSTMHKLTHKKFEIDDFSHEHLDAFSVVHLEHLINYLNKCRENYLGDYGKINGQKGMWWQMIQLLPSSYNQLRTVTMNYENLVNIYYARKDHKLDEWREFCKWIETLPYSELITGGKDDCADQIENFPAADVVEVRHGEWIYHELVLSYDGALSGYSCSLCGAFVDEEIYESNEIHNKYCGNCGAKMDGIHRGSEA